MVPKGWPCGCTILRPGSPTRSFCFIEKARWRLQETAIGGEEKPEEEQIGIYTNCTSYAFGGGLNRTPVLMCAFPGNSMLIKPLKVGGKNWNGGGSMRVITGVAKGRRLESVSGRKTRPTADRVKESLFSILGERVLTGRFLDLYAGSGAIGIEALSRGAPGAVFVDNSRAAIQVIKGNLQRVGLADHAEVHNTDVSRAIAILAKRDIQFGCIFMDPPYGQGKIMETLLAISRVGLAGADTLVIVEHSRDEPVPERIETLRRIRIQKYGDTEISFLIIQDSLDS